MDPMGKAFLEKFDLWLQENTKELPVTDSEDCPVCEQYTREDESLIQCFGTTADIGVSMSSGPWDACSWTELRRCNNPECLAFFLAENCNY